MSLTIDYTGPSEVVETMIKSGINKAALRPKDLLIRGGLSGALLGFATSLALTGTLQTGVPLVGALIFPVGFIMIVLLGLELVTGSFALVPLAYREGKITLGQLIGNLSWVFLGNLIGSVVYGVLLYLCITMSGQVAPDALASKIVSIAEAKTIGYAKYGAAGMLTCFTKAMLCNWMVTLGVVMAMTSKSTLGKIVAAWLPIVTFFAQGFEHSVVNMFMIPTGMLLGAKVSMVQWWLWNQLPVTLGNLAGGYLFTGLALYLTHKPKSNTVPAPVPAAEMLSGRVAVGAAN